MKDKIEQIEQESKELENITNDIIKKYAVELEREMLKIRELLQDEITDYALEQSILELANILYFTSAGQEIIGIKEDVARSKNLDKYNKLFIEVGKTVKEKEALAELGTQQETLVNLVYNRAYKKLKQKVEAGYEMLTSLKKIMTKRCLEMELNKSEL